MERGEVVDLQAHKELDVPPALWKAAPAWGRSHVQRPLPQPQASGVSYPSVIHTSRGPTAGVSGGFAGFPGLQSTSCGGIGALV